MLRIVLAGLVCLGMLGGCGAIREARTARDIDRCESYGFVPGSPEFAQCRMKLDGDRRRPGVACFKSGTTMICN